MKNMKHKFHANALNATMCLSIIPSPAVITSSGEASVNSTAFVSVIGVKVISAHPAGTSGGTSMVSRWFSGISTVIVTLIKNYPLVIVSRNCSGVIAAIEPEVKS